MANHVSALKRARQTGRRTERNRANASRLRTSVKKLQQAIASGDHAAAHALLNDTLSAIDKGIQKGVLHHNAADRHKSRLTLAFNQLAAK